MPTLLACCGSVLRDLRTRFVPLHAATDEQLHPQREVPRRTRAGDDR